LNRNFITTYSSLSVGLQELTEIQCSHVNCHHLVGHGKGHLHRTET